MRFCCLFIAAFASFSSFASSSKIPESNPFRKTQLGVSVQDDKKQIKIYFSGNVTGMRESCGCALNPKGGLERRYNFLKKEGLLEAKNDTLILDFGNLLFKTPDFEKGGEKEALANAEKMIEGSNLFNLSAVNFGIMDRTLSPERLSSLWAKSKFPWLASNINPPGRFGGRFSRRIPLKLKTGEAVIFGISSMDDKLKANGWVFTPPAEALAKELADLPANVFPIVLSDVEMSELLPMAAQIKRPILILGSRETGGWDRPIEVGQALLLHLRQQGQDWGLIKFNPHQRNKAGWYNPADSETFAQRWDDLVSEVKAIRALASSEQKNIEVKNLEAKLQELAKLAPKNTDYQYSFETTEMNAAYNGKNEATPFMK